MQSYSQDLRDRVLRALSRGEGPTAIAQRFEVSRVWVSDVRDRELKTGIRSSYQIGGHRRSRAADSESEIRGWIEEKPDLTLEQLCQLLAEKGVTIKSGALWHQLNKWNLTFKKNAARQRAGTRGRAAGAPSVAASAAHNGSRKARVYR